MQVRKPEQADQSAQHKKSQHEEKRMPLARRQARAEMPPSSLLKGRFAGVLFLSHGWNSSLKE